ncbi:HAD family hydrolase [Thermodesulforhabdus norvegica]|uniref:Putative hydrolase of the HAD superfamily n=1 Tax=Thermodesulforhabdus norvegica TaxID=39841 RepID=A0A1I4W9I2_9BACT|nr:HAD family hydrolase [Thermodesulforhabdus norvegica]SFN10381.1 putative hydrolase of the HAD superfamily [Thermodesulforhabdus norvegica]
MSLFESPGKYEDVFADFSRPPAVRGRESLWLQDDLPVPRAVLFDVYDTLVRSTIGDLEEQRRRKSDSSSFVDTALRFGFNSEIGARWHTLFFDYIEEEHSRCRRLGIMRAEVLVERIWDRILKETVPERSRFEEDARKIGLYRELKANPVAHFEGVLELWSFLNREKILVGLVTNAQYYTLPVLSWVLNVNLADYLTPQIVICSYALGYAKPDPYFFRYVETQIRRLGLESRHVWVVGNDPENDMAAAKPYGFTTVLFTGSSSDAKSADADASAGSFFDLKKLIQRFLKGG